MFLAFNKDAIEGKTFRDFGKGMEAKYGHAKEVYRDEKMMGGVKHILDHFEWSAGGDKLRLIDRSEFYGVYCLVLSDAGTQERANEKRKVVNPDQPTGDALVEAVTAKDNNDRDANDNIIDRITGKEIRKPGDEEKHDDIVVPSVGGGEQEGRRRRQRPRRSRRRRAARTTDWSCRAPLRVAGALGPPASSRRGEPLAGRAMRRAWLA